jgi:hypothetical protein
MKMSVLAVIAAVGALIAVPGVSAACRAAVPSCASVLSKGQILKAMGGSPVLRTVPVYRSKDSVWADGPNYKRGRHIFTTGCFYGWTYTTSSGVPAGDPDPDTNLSEFLAPNPFVWVGSGVTAREWGYIRANEKADPGGETDGCGGCSYSAQRPLRLGAGSKAFVESFDVPVPASATHAPYAKSYMLYILTKHHNLLEISVWPAGLATQETLALGVLKKFKNF